MIDLVTPIEEDGAVSIITLDSEDGLYILRHSTAHLLAQALKRLYKDVKVELGIGPVIENGFTTILIWKKQLQLKTSRKSKRNAKIVNENLEIVRHEVPRAEAIRRFEEIGDELKLDLINDLPEDAVISIYEQGEFFDLCRVFTFHLQGKLKCLNY